MHATRESRSRRPFEGRVRRSAFSVQRSEFGVQPSRHDRSEPKIDVNRSPWRASRGKARHVLRAIIDFVAAKTHLNVPSPTRRRWFGSGAAVRFRGRVTSVFPRSGRSGVGRGGDGRENDGELRNRHEPPRKPTDIRTTPRFAPQTVDLCRNGRGNGFTCAGRLLHAPRRTQHGGHSGDTSRACALRWRLSDRSALLSLVFSIDFDIQRGRRCPRSRQGCQPSETKYPASLEKATDRYIFIVLSFHFLRCVISTRCFK